MQADYVVAILRRAAQAPALAGIHVKNVSITAVRDAEHDPVLTIVWSMPDPDAAIDRPTVPGVAMTVLSRPSDTAILLRRDLANPAEIEDAMIAAAWSLGAWDLCRIESPPLPRDADWRDRRYGLADRFGHNSYIIEGQPLISGQRAHDDVCALAAASGYITWRFVPLALATPMMRARWAGKDATLQPDCERPGVPGPHRGTWHNPTTPGQANEHQYQLGRGNHGNRSKASRERRA